MRESIVSRMIAKKLLENSREWIGNPQTNIFNSLFQQGSHEIWFHMRHCYRQAYPDIDFSGGIVFGISLGKSYEHTSKTLRYEYRFKAGRWTKEKLLKKISQGVAFLLGEKQVWDARESLYLKADPIARNMPENELEEMLTKAEAQGIAVAYDAMGIESLDYWNKLFR